MPSFEPAAGGWLLVVAGISAIGTWISRRYALRRRLVDEPGERRSHSAATPRGGGIAIVAAVLCAAGWMWVHAFAPMERALVAAFATGLVLVGGVGWVDDHRPLSPWTRLAVHVVAAGGFAGVTWWVTADALATGVAFVAPLVLANVWNFMDGIDGLAASQAALAALVASAWLPSPASWLALALAAACMGFLPFNYPRARIFMGDVGSGAVGFALGALLSWFPRSGAGEIGWAAILACLPMCAFLLDASLTLARRILAGDRWWEPHVGHAYQRLVRATGRHWPVTLGYFVFTLGAGATALVVGSVPGGAAPGTVTIALFAWLAIGGALWIRIQCGGKSQAGENME